jgi:phage replication-related protein YjqB (UPF0714/DUF867 family)
VSRPTVRTAHLGETATGHCTEYLYDDRSNDGTLVCAAHGGGVEPGTAEQAIELATTLGATCWARLGYDEDDAFEEWHPPSSSIGVADHPLLSAIADREFETVLSLHGLGDEGVLVGGGAAAETKRSVANCLDERVTPPVAVVSEGPYAGTNPDNFVNWLAAGSGGIQIEQGPAVRRTESQAVVEVLEELLESGAV